MKNCFFFYCRIPWQGNRTKKLLLKKRNSLLFKKKNWMFLYKVNFLILTIILATIFGRKRNIYVTNICDTKISHRGIFTSWGAQGAINQMWWQKRFEEGVFQTHFLHNIFVVSRFHRAWEKPSRRTYTLPEVDCHMQTLYAYVHNHYFETLFFRKLFLIASRNKTIQCTHVHRAAP